MNFVSDFDADHNEIIERIRSLKGKQNWKGPVFLTI